MQGETTFFSCLADSRGYIAYRNLSAFKLEVRITTALVGSRRCGRDGMVEAKVGFLKEVFWRLNYSHYYTRSEIKKAI